MANHRYLLQGMHWRHGLDFLKMRRDFTISGIFAWVGIGKRIKKLDARSKLCTFLNLLLISAKDVQSGFFEIGNLIWVFYFLRLPSNVLGFPMPWE